MSFISIQAQIVIRLIDTCSLIGTVILWFIMRNIYLVLLLVSATKFLKYLEYPKGWSNKYVFCYNNKIIFIHTPETGSRPQRFSSVQFSSVTQLCLTLCDPMNCSTPGLSVHHQLPEYTQTHVHWVGDAIQTSHPLSSPSPPAPNPFQHQSLFQWVNSSHEVVKVLEFQL